MLGTPIINHLRNYGKGTGGIWAITIYKARRQYARGKLRGCGRYKQREENDRGKQLLSEALAGRLQVS